MFPRLALLMLTAAVGMPSVTAICGGFNFAIGNVIPNGGGAGVNRCERIFLFLVLYKLTTHGLTQGMFTTIVAISMTG